MAWKRRLKGTMLLYSRSSSWSLWRRADGLRTTVSSPKALASPPGVGGLQPPAKDHLLFPQSFGFSTRCRGSAAPSQRPVAAQPPWGQVTASTAPGLQGTPSQYIVSVGFTFQNE